MNNKLSLSGMLIDLDNLDRYLNNMKNKSSIASQKFWKGKKVIITGSAGMVGSTMMDRLMQLGADPVGITKRHSKKIDYHNTIDCDLKDYKRVKEIFSQEKPEIISHQAAESFIPMGFHSPNYVVDNNCLSTSNILEAAYEYNRDGLHKRLQAVHVACSSEEYGFVKEIEELPIKESNPLRPCSTYASTKVFTEYAALAYYLSYGLPTIITRCFNQEGPRRGREFFTARIAIQINELLNKKIKKLRMGNQESVRDFTHINDSVEAQLLAIEKANKGEPYNICSGWGITTGDYAKLALDMFDLVNDIEIDKSLLRPYERGEALFDGFIGSNKKINEKTGWFPTKTILDIIKDQVKYFGDV